MLIHPARPRWNSRSFFLCRRFPAACESVRGSWQFAALAIICSALPRTAGAFPIQTSATDACHENITASAWRRASEKLPEEVTRKLPSRGDDAALIEDVPFDIPSGLGDIGGVTLLLGIRDNDIKEYGPTDLEELAPVQSDPEHQHEHCLRAPDQDEPDGSEEALETCRNHIRKTLLSALDGLDDAGVPDGEKRDDLRVSLAIRGDVDVRVPRFFLRAGRALHTLQDSFTHTYRNVDDPHLVTVVLNFVDYAENHLEESVDGPPHSSELDRCDDPDELRAKRHALAIEASTDALVTVLDPTQDREGKERGIDALLDEYLSFDTSQDCTYDNGWCDAPERDYSTSRCGCRTVGGPSPSGGAGAALLVAGAVLARRRRARRAGAALGGLALAVGLLASPAAANAQTAQEADAPSGPVAALTGESDAATVGSVDRGGAFFGRIAAGASYDSAALSGGLGIRYQLSRPLMLGLDGEWNPYIAVTPGKIRSGSFNTYLSLIHRIQLKYEALNVRTTLSAGASVLLFDLVGAPAGSVGPFFGVSLLGAEWKMARGFYLTIDPTYIAIPIPHVTGTPFMYTQYRFLLGLEFGG